MSETAAQIYSQASRETYEVARGLFDLLKTGVPTKRQRKSWETIMEQVSNDRRETDAAPSFTRDYQIPTTRGQESVPARGLFTSEEAIYSKESESPVNIEGGLNLLLQGCFSSDRATQLTPELHFAAQKLAGFFLRMSHVYRTCEKRPLIGSDYMKRGAPQRGESILRYL